MRIGRVFKGIAGASISVVYIDLPLGVILLGAAGAGLDHLLGWEFVLAVLGAMAAYTTWVWLDFDEARSDTSLAGC
jgi:hypothetical protein